MREAKRNVAVIDQFPALDADGWNKRSGLIYPGSFVVSIWRDAVVQSTSVLITEIGTSGEYRIRFTPDADGYWVVEVLVDFAKQLLRFAYQIVEVTTNEQARKLDLNATVGPGAMTSGSLGDRLMNADATKSFQQSRDSLQGIRRFIIG